MAKVKVWCHRLEKFSKLNLLRSHLIAWGFSVSAAHLFMCLVDPELSSEEYLFPSGDSLCAAPCWGQVAICSGMCPVCHRKMSVIPQSRWLAVFASACGDQHGVFSCLHALISCSRSIITAALQTVLEFSGFWSPFSHADRFCGSRVQKGPSGDDCPCSSSSGAMSGKAGRLGWLDLGETITQTYLPLQVWQLRCGDVSTRTVPGARRPWGSWPLTWWSGLHEKTFQQTKWQLHHSAVLSWAK